jgi:hypothetical protein
MRRSLLLVVIGVFANGCFLSVITVSPRNAPGDVDVASAPVSPVPRTPEEPEDPGTQIVLVTARGVVSGGFATDGGREARWSYANGGEASISYGRDLVGAIFATPLSLVSEKSIVQVLPDRGIAERMVRVNFGWMPDLEDDQPSRTYVELELDGRIFGAGLGYLWEPNGTEHGFQVTARMLFLFARAAHLGNRGTSFVLGTDLAALTAGWAWSR